MAKTSASLPKTTPPAPSEDRPEAFAFWSMVAITIAGAILLVAIGRGPAPDKAKAEVSAATDSTEPVKLPQPIEPIGIVETAPLQFRWTPGSDDVDLAQVIVFKGDMTRIWESAPTDSNVVSIPLHMYNAVVPMEPMFWRVREVVDGKPRAASDLKPFKIKNLPQRSPPAGTSAG